MGDSCVQLHCHSSLSFRDGLPSPDQMAQRVAELGQPGLGITEHGHMYSAPAFASACKKHGVRGVQGIEIYESISTTMDTDPTGPDHARFKEKWSADIPRYFHLTLWAMNQTGWENLVQITNQSFTKAYKPKNQPLVDQATLRRYSDGIICGLGCPQSRVNWTLRHHGYKAAQDAAQWYVETFEDRLYVEVMSALQEQVAMLADQRKLAKHFGRPTVGTNDVHYLTREDGVFNGPHHMLVISRKFKSAATAGEQSTDKSDVASGSYYGSDSFFYKTRQEMIQSGIFANEVDVSLEILDRVEFDFLGQPEPKPPVAKIPTGDPNFEQYVKQAVLL